MSARWGAPADGAGFVEEVRALQGKNGAYIIRSSGSREILYVGESHTGRLYETLTRHFQEWTGPTAGQVYDRARVEIAVFVTDAARAQALQYELIATWLPRDNYIGKDDDEEDVPF